MPDNLQSCETYISRSMVKSDNVESRWTYSSYTTVNVRHMAIMVGSFTAIEASISQDKAMTDNLQTYISHVIQCHPPTH